MRENQRLQAKTALITGEEGSVHFAITRRSTREGASVFRMYPDDPEFRAEIQAVVEKLA
jgi:NAD(P)-dependent dehydrogenase (short-subunit alcohol dehydrogenase family)